MLLDRPHTDRSNGASSYWLARIVVLSAFGATLWLAGPRAYAALSTRLSARAAAGSPRVDLERVGIVELPEWLRGPLLQRCLEDLAPRLSGEIAIMDEAAAVQTKAGLEASPYVQSARLERAFPDRLIATLALREPVLEVQLQADAPDAAPVAYLDRDAVVLPAGGKIGLPRVLAVERPRPEAFGRPAADDRLRAAAAVAAEWRDQIVRLCANSPRLVEVDASNLQYRRIGDGRLSEVRIAVARDDGGVCWLCYTHPPGSRWPRVSCPVLAGVLMALLDEHPGLRGVAQADLRFAKRWREWVRMGDAREGG